MLITGAALGGGSAVAGVETAGALAGAGLSAGPALGVSVRLGAWTAPPSGLALVVAVIPAPRSSSAVGLSRSSVWSAALACGRSSATVASLPGLAFVVSVFRAAPSGWAAAALAATAP